MQYDISVIKNGAAIRVKTYNTTRLVHSIDILEGKHYIIQPDNPLKMRNRGRVCVVEKLTLAEPKTRVVKIRFLDSNRVGKANLEDLKVYYANASLKEKLVQHVELDDLQRYLPEDVPENLFTKNKLDQVGLLATNGHVAYVTYPEQRREFKLFDIVQTRTRKKQSTSNSILLTGNKTIEDLLKEREIEINIRREQLKKYIKD